MEKQGCGCWLDLEKGMVIPVCGPHFDLAVSRVKAGEKTGLKLSDFSESGSKGSKI